MSSEKEILKRKQDIRNALRQEYWKKFTQPINAAPGTFLLDTGNQRYQAVQPTRAQYFKPHAWSGLMYTAFIIAPLFGTILLFKTRRENKETAMRTGQVAYADRKFKFVN